MPLQPISLFAQGKCDLDQGRMRTSVTHCDFVTLCVTRDHFRDCKRGITFSEDCVDSLSHCWPLLWEQLAEWPGWLSDCLNQSCLDISWERSEDWQVLDPLNLLFDI
jgi:hypothetical protein